MTAESQKLARFVAALFADAEFTDGIEDHAELKDLAIELGIAEEVVQNRFVEDDEADVAYKLAQWVRDHLATPPTEPALAASDDPCPHCEGSGKARCWNCDGTGVRHDVIRDSFKSAPSACDEPALAAEGDFVLVPCKPTEVMLDAMAAHQDKFQDGCSWRGLYEAAIKAAPHPARDAERWTQGEIDAAKAEGERLFAIFGYRGRLRMSADTPSVGSCPLNKADVVPSESSPTTNNGDTPVRFVETLSLFDPARMPERDADGYVSHPDLDLRCWYDGDPENEAPIARASFEALGFAIYCVDRYIDAPAEHDENDPNDETCGGMYDKGGGAASWNPTPPEGAGWQLVAIYDSEDGPTSLFVRRMTPLDSASRPQHETPSEALTFDAFRAANVARCAKWHPAGIESWSPSNWLTAVTGELGELASLLKMRNRERDGLPGNKFSPTQKQIADEIADVVTYLDLLAHVLGVDLGRAAVAKFNEVSERVGFPDRIALASRSQPARGDVSEAAAWMNKKGHVVSDRSKRRFERFKSGISTPEPINSYTIPLFLHPERGEVSEAEVEAAADIILAESGETRESVGEYSFSIIKAREG